MEWQVKVREQNCGREGVKPKHQPDGFACSLIAEMKQNLLCGCLDC